MTVSPLLREIQADKFTPLGLPRRYWPEEGVVTGELFRLRGALAIKIPKLGLNFEGYLGTFHGNMLGF
ncbi:MAG: hypothetical protein QW638_07435 [Candidatus Bathyarchaeia archaeon]|nr:hypothetical protein [Candidatus Bathyarchaeota archaeon]